MNTIFKNYFFYLWKEAATYNNSILASHIEPQEKARILDIGSDSGELITQRVQNVKKPEIYGIDLRKEASNKSKKISIKALVGNVEDGLPFKSSFFDIVSANQIIEHLRDLDFFLEEIHRVLKPQGYLILSTENLSSWHNILALCLGWQAFSQHVSSYRSIGNPLSIGHNTDYKSGTMHIKILTPRGLRELAKLHNFKIEEFFGAGYYPLPSFLSKCLSRLDPTHSAFIGIKARKIK